MFPYDQIPVSKVRTSLDIERFGIQSLLRALNIGRVMAFVGSGASIKFGQPSWEGLKKEAVKCFDKVSDCIDAIKKSNYRENGAIQDFIDEYHSTLSELAKEIQVHKEENTINVIYLIGLCEEYFTEVRSLLNMSIEIKQELRSEKVSLSSEHLEALELLDYFRDFFAKQFSSVDPASLKHGAPRKEHLLRGTKGISEQCQLLFGLTYKNYLNGGIKWEEWKRYADDFDHSIESLDISRSVFRYLGISRFLTLNYDLEIERMLLEESRSSPEKPFGAFKEFIDYSGSDIYEDIEIFKKKGFVPGQSITLSSASGRIIRSTSSRPETLADLFAFGAFPTNYDASVHHLHGRVDDPENMIVTPSDYQKIYYGKSEQIKSFDEARHAVFTGSDLLVFGMGYSEADVLKPLRDLLEFEVNKLDAYGKVYYLTASKLEGHDNFIDAFNRANSVNKALSQELFQTYKTHALFVDFSFESPGNNDAWDCFQSLIFFARCEFAHYKKSIKDKRYCYSSAESFVFEENDMADIKLWGFGDGYFKKIFKRRSDDFSQENEQLDIQSAKVLAAQKLGRAILNNFNYLIKNNVISKRDLINCTIETEKVVNAIDAQLFNLALSGYAQKLSYLRGEWWKKWSDTPGMRLAVYGAHGYHSSEKKIVLAEGDRENTDTPLVWKQTNLICFYDKPTIALGDKENTPQFTSFMESTVLALEETRASLVESECFKPPKNPAVVVRICMPSGTGKGRLVSFFTNQQKIKTLNKLSISSIEGSEKGKDDSKESVEFPFRRLFNAKERGINYIGIFSIELTFALEFSSLVVGLGRYLQNILPDIRVISKDPTNNKWGYFLDHMYHQPEKIEPAIEHLRKLFKFLQEVCPDGGWLTRIIIMLSDLDKVVDESGDAYSPVHRSFFRLISGWHNQEQHSLLPIDFILIASKSEQPIRYLSVEKRFSEKEHRLDERWRYGRWVIRRDRQCALQVWYEIEQLKPDRLAEEALLYAILCKGDRLYCRSINHSLTAKDEDIKWARGILKKIIEAINPPERKMELELSECLPQGLRYFLRRRTIHAFIISALAAEVWFLADQQCSIENKGSVTLNDNEKEKQQDIVRSRFFIKIWNSYTHSLSAAYTKNRSVGYFEELFKIYANIYRLRENITYRDSGVFPQAFKWRKEESELCIALERLRAVIVDHMALFAHPVSVEVLAACPEIKIAVHRCLQYEEYTNGDEPIGNILREMATCGLAARYWKYSKLRIKKGSVDSGQADNKLLLAESANDCVFTLDPEIISVVREKNGLSKHNATYIIPHQSSLYTSQLDHSVKPEMHHFKRVSKIVRALLQNPHQDLIGYYHDSESWERVCASDKVAFVVECSDKFRAAYALIRGTFSLAVLSRLDNAADNLFTEPPFDEYRTWVRMCLNSATLLAKIIKKTNRNDDSLTSENVLEFNEPFFRDEIAWLYNERALVSFVQGRLFDALPLYDQSIRVIGRKYSIEHAISSRSQYRRIRLNQALAQLERGHLGMAKSILESILRATEPRWISDTPSTIHIYAKGYMALCHHLSDDYTSASSMYINVIEKLKEEGHIRGQSIFRRHYADLLRAMSKSREDKAFIEATNQLRTAEELAIGIRAVDLQNYALIARARLERDKANRQGALESLRHAENYARRMGIYKMLAEVFKVRGEVLLAEGEATQAGYVTSQSIAIAKRHGMRLRKISAALIQSNILKMRGQRKDAERLLNEVLQESLALGYTTKASVATKLLSELW